MLLPAFLQSVTVKACLLVNLLGVQKSIYQCVVNKEVFEMTNIDRPTSIFLLILGFSIFVSIIDISYLIDKK